MSTQKDQQEMEKIVQEATLRYPDVERHRISAKKLFSKILGIQFYATDGITNAELRALSGTLMYFAVDKQQQHFIDQYLHAMLRNDDHHEQVLASALINKLFVANYEKKLASASDSVRNSLLAKVNGTAWALSEVVHWGADNVIAIEFPWSLSRKEIKELLREDKAVLSFFKWVKFIGYGGLTIGKLIEWSKEIVFLRLTPWSSAVVALIFIINIIELIDGKSEESLMQEGANRGMNDLFD